MQIKTFDFAEIEDLLYLIRFDYFVLRIILATEIRPIKKIGRGKKNARGQKKKRKKRARTENGIRQNV